MNSVNISGRLTKDVEAKSTQSGKNYVKFTVAVQRDKENADFIQCTAWEKTCDFIAQYFKKGDGIEISGSIQTGKFTNKEGAEVFTTDVYVQKVGFGVGKKSENSEAPKEAKKKSAPPEDDDEAFPF